MYFNHAQLYKQTSAPPNLVIHIVYTSYPHRSKIVVPSGYYAQPVERQRIIPTKLFFVVGYVVGRNDKDTTYNTLIFNDLKRLLTFVVTQIPNVVSHASTVHIVCIVLQYTSAYTAYILPKYICLNTNNRLNFAFPGCCRFASYTYYIRVMPL